MGSNRQPIDRETALNLFRDRVSKAHSEAVSLYQTDSLSVYVSSSREGKIAGIRSISVVPDNVCLTRWITMPDTVVCHHCYAVGALMTYRINVVRRLVHNAVLMSGPVRDHAIPRGLIGPVRINAFGEVLNDNHVAWIMKIARANPKATFSLITKKAWMFPLQRRPRNLILITSYMQIGNLAIDAHADKTYAVVHEVTDEIMTNHSNSPCQDRCMACYMHGINCYSKKGPRRIIRPLQPAPIRTALETGDLSI